MGKSISKATRTQRWRSRGTWGLIIGGIGYLACILGLVQYWISGKVSIRPGHEAIEGNTAIYQLIFIGLISTLFFALGILFKYLGRHKASLRDF